MDHQWGLSAMFVVLLLINVNIVRSEPGPIIQSKSSTNDIVRPAIARLVETSLSPLNHDGKSLLRETEVPALDINRLDNQQKRTMLRQILTQEAQQSCLSQFLCNVPEAAKPNNKTSTVNDYTYLVKNFIEIFDFLSFVDSEDTTKPAREENKKSKEEDAGEDDGDDDEDDEEDEEEDEPSGRTAVSKLKVDMSSKDKKLASAITSNSAGSIEPDKITMIQKVTLEDLLGNLEFPKTSESKSLKTLERQLSNSKSTGYLSYKVRHMRMLPTEEEKLSLVNTMLKKMRKPRQCKHGDRPATGSVSDTASALLSTCPVTAEVIDYLSKKMANGSNIGIKRPPPGPPSPLQRPGQQGFIIIGNGKEGSANVVSVQQNGFGYRPTNYEPYQPLSTTNAPIPEIDYPYPLPVSQNGRPPARPPLPSDKKETKDQKENEEDDTSEEDDDLDDDEEEEADYGENDSESAESNENVSENDNEVEEDDETEGSEENDDEVPAESEETEDELVESEENGNEVPAESEEAEDELVESGENHDTRERYDEVDDEAYDDKTRAAVEQASISVKSVANPPSQKLQQKKIQTSGRPQIITVYGKPQASFGTDFHKIADNFGSSVTVLDEDEIFSEANETKTEKPLTPLDIYLQTPFNFFEGPQLFPPTEAPKKTNKTVVFPTSAQVESEKSQADTDAEYDEVSSSEEEEDDYNDYEDSSEDYEDDTQYWRTILNLRKKIAHRHMHRLGAPIARHRFVRPMQHRIMHRRSPLPPVMMHRSSASIALPETLVNTNSASEETDSIIDERVIVLPQSHFAHGPINPIRINPYFKRGRRSVRRRLPIHAPSIDLMMNPKPWPLRMQPPHAFFSHALG